MNIGAIYNNIVSIITLRVVQSIGVFWRLQLLSYKEKQST